MRNKTMTKTVNVSEFKTGTILCVSPHGENALTTDCRKRGRDRWECIDYDGERRIGRTIATDAMMASLLSQCGAWADVS